MFADILLVSDGLLQVVESIDKQLLLAVNGSDSPFLDRLVCFLTEGETWIPLYLGLLYMVLKNNNSIAKLLSVLGAVAVCYLITGCFDDTIVKTLVARWRPTHDPDIGMMVQIVDGYRGGHYGFFSAHACNTISVAIFFYWLTRNRTLTTTLVFWSLLNCWTRLYLGVHYPSDILVGLIWGFCAATGVYYIYSRLMQRLYLDKQPISIHYTQSGYEHKDFIVPVIIFCLTLLFAVLKALIIGTDLSL